MEEKREQLIRQLRGYGISDRVLRVMRRVPRHVFVPPEYREQAYEDTPLPIGREQTISAPHMVAIMTDYLDPREGHRVLDVGAGSGYHAAILAQLVGPGGHVYAVERVESLAQDARENLREAGVENVSVVVGDGTQGLEEHAPYDRVNVAAAAREVPGPLVEQLKTGGKMVIPVGTWSQTLLLVEKLEDEIKETPLTGVMFVPLVGEEAGQR